MTGWNSQCLHDIIQLGIRKCNRPRGALQLHESNMHIQCTHTYLERCIKHIYIQCTCTHRFAVAQVEPPIDASQDIRNASAERVGGVTTITFNRPRNSCDINDISLDPCRFFLFAYGGRAVFFAAPPVAIYHEFGSTRRAASAERICIPTFTECSAGEFTTVLLLPISYSIHFVI